jgi:hypothetical protein
LQNGKIETFLNGLTYHDIYYNMVQDFIIKRELFKLKKQKLNEANTYGFPTGAVDSGKVNPGGEGGNWGGSMEKTLEIASFAKKCLGKDNVISSQKRSRVKTASGNVSDHYKGNTNAYAVDIPVRGKAGDELLACIMKSWNNGSHSSYKGGVWLNVTKDGYRYQFGWKVKNHYDHIHVGVKKTSGSNSKYEKPEDEKPEDVSTDVNTEEKPSEESQIEKLGLGAFAKLARMMRGEKEKPSVGTTLDPVEKEDEEEVDKNSPNVIVDLKDYKITEPSSEDKGFYTKVLSNIGAPISKENLLFFYAWRQAEGAKSTYNPFNTTQSKEGSTLWNCLSKKNDKCVGGVRNYKTKQDGIDATVKTMKNGNYKCIVDGLKSNKGAVKIAECPDLKKWGTGAGVTRVLKTKKINPPAISKTEVKSVKESFNYETERISDLIKKVL